MEPQLHESRSQVSLPVLRRLLASSGVSIDKATLPTGEVMNAALEFYRAAMADPVTAPAAFGMGVAIVSNNLEVNIRAAALIFSAMVDMNPPG